MDSVYYTSGTGGTIIELASESLFIGDGSGLRSRSWNYDIGTRSLRGVSRTAREVSFDLASTNLSALDGFRRIADRDMQNGTPGVIEVPGGYKQRAYIVGCEPKTIYGDFVDVRISAVLLDGYWWRLNTTNEFGSSDEDQGEDANSGFLDYPYDYAYDYTFKARSRDRVNVGISDAPVYIVVHGPAINPEIVIGGNAYTVNTSVPAGADLVIDGMNRTINVVYPDGTSVSAFGAGVRGTGEGSGEYVFQPLPAGESRVVWDGFAFTLGFYETDGEPVWAWR